MTRFFLLITLLVCTAMPAHASDRLNDILREIKANDVPKTHPALTIPFFDENHRKTNLARYQGTALLVNFWATWCAPCVKEMPVLDTLQAKYKKRGLKVISVSQDFGGMPKVKKFYKRMKLKHMDMYVDDKNQLFGAFDGNSLPFTVLIDKHGTIQHQQAGFINWNGAAEQRAIEQLLAQ